MKNPIIVITGPTASGKTSISIEMAKKFGGEIINADSRSIYKGMDIGTGKPTTEERQDIPHHLFDIVSPNKRFSVSEFKNLATEKIDGIRSRGKIPFIVGGTALYIDALVYDYDMPEAKPDLGLRTKLEKKSTDELFKELSNVDTKTSQKIDSHNRPRVIRALEIFYKTGKSKVMQEKKKSLPKNILYLAVETDRQELYDTINKRVEGWMDGGFTNEVKGLLKKYSLDDPGMSGIGYKQFGLYLNGKITLAEAINKFQQGDRNLAKRQLTWLNRNKDVIWIENEKEAERNINFFLNQ